MSIKPMRTLCCRSFQILLALITPLLLMSRLSAMEPKSVTFQGRISEHKWPLQELNRDMTTDWSAYEYEPTRQLKRTFALAGRPIVIGEFHFGVPANGLGAGLVQTQNQSERALGYRYYVEQAMALPYFLGAHWFQWQDQPVMGRRDGENYNIGLVDVTNRPYPELVQALKATHKVLYDVHTGKVKPFSQRPMASEAGTPRSPWD